MGILPQAGQPLTCQQIRELDARTIEQVGIPGLVLMENAGRGVAEFIWHSLMVPERSSVLVLCGVGNNGGDGLVVARHLHNAGVPVAVALAVPPDRPTGDAAVNLRIVERMPVRLIRAFEPAGLEEVQTEAQRADVIVDALLGTGSRGAPHGVVAELIQIANAASRCRRVAVDVPSGLDGDTGQVHEPCFRADATVTMVAPKIGFGAPRAGAVVGRVVVVDIGTPQELIPGRQNPGAGG